MVFDKKEMGARIDYYEFSTYRWFNAWDPWLLWPPTKTEINLAWFEEEPL